MGNEQAKDKKGPTKPIDKNKLDLLLKQIYFTAQLNRDRRRGQQLSRDKELLALIREAPNKRSLDNEYHKAAALVNDAKWLKAYEIILRYADILKDNATVIQLSKGDTSKIQDLLPYIESLVWGCQKCNLDCIDAFKTFIIECFGQDVYEVVSMGSKVTPELKNCFDSILPTEREVKQHFVLICNQYGLDLAMINEIGHNIDPVELAKPELKKEDTFQPNQNIPQNQNQGQFHPGPYPQNPHQYPQQQFPQYPPQNPHGGYPQQGGNFYPPYNQNPYPSYPQHPQGGYPQPPNQGNLYPQFSQHPHQGQGGYPQQPFYPGPNNGYPQNPNQGGHGYSQQNSYQQPQSFQPQNVQVTLNHQGSFPKNNQQPGGPQNPSGSGSNQGFSGPGSNQGFSGSQNPSGSGGSQGYSAPQNKVPENKPEVKPSNDFGGDDGSYPIFQKFADLNVGGKPSSDPLDELDARLKNIKGGL